MHFKHMFFSKFSTLSAEGGEGGMGSDPSVEFSTLFLTGSLTGLLNDFTNVTNVN